MRRPVIVSIQSQLVYGCAGNNAAVPLLQRLGACVHAVPTALLSNTPHYPTFGGGPVDPGLIENLLSRLLDRVSPTGIDAILTGYIASSGTASAAAAFIDKVRNQHPGVVVMCDPVMGDIDHGLDVEDTVANAIARELVPRADILTPNLFEARRLASEPTADGPELLDAMLAGRPSVAAVTGIDTTGESVATVAPDRNSIWKVATRRLDLHPTGTGDIFSAAFLYRFLHTKDTRRSLETGVAAVVALLEACRSQSAGELESAQFGPNNTCHAVMLSRR